jgi:hypothetical protein
VRKNTTRQPTATNQRKTYALEQRARMKVIKDSLAVSAQPAGLASVVETPLQDESKALAVVAVVVVAAAHSPVAAGHNGWGCRTPRV